MNCSGYLYKKNEIVGIALILAFGVFLYGSVSCGAQASGTTDNGLLPNSGFLAGWAMEGKAETYSRDNLYKLINGEAELYLPYGFERLTTAYYGLGDKAKTSLSVEIYKMGSGLDAFGIYSNYRSPESEALSIGSDGFVAEGQLLFYQDRYFVRLSASGVGKPDRKVFLACASAVAAQLPASASAPRELDLLKSTQITPRTEKFVAESLLGYKFFRRGLTAEATVEGKPAKFFVVLTESDAAASATLDLYIDSLKKEGVTPQVRELKGKTLSAEDPLYKGIVIRQVGASILGIAKLENIDKGIDLLDHWLSNR